MKTCPNCRNQVLDEAVFCPICGSAMDAAPQYQQPPTQPNPPYNSTYTQPPVPAAPIPYVNPFDHTKDFDAADISENKVFAMIMYLLGPLGVIIGLLGADDSKYVAFHVRQVLKLTVAEILGILALAAVSYVMWNIRLRSLMMFVIVVALIGLVVLHLICFLQVCKEKAKEVYIVRNLRFMK